jgi:hypothetical protein
LLRMRVLGRRAMHLLGLHLLGEALPGQGAGDGIIGRRMLLRRCRMGWRRYVRARLLRLLRHSEARQAIIRGDRAAASVASNLLRPSPRHRSITSVRA